MIDDTDYYTALGLAPDSSREEIVAARRKTLRALHPDTNGSPAAAERFDEAYKMFAVLCDPDRRAAYDRSRTTAARTLLLCRECGGAGISAIISCETCGGGGRSSIGFSPTCTACDGLGRLGIVCDLCHGAGWR